MCVCVICVRATLRPLLYTHSVGRRRRRRLRCVRGSRHAAAFTLSCILLIHISSLHLKAKYKPRVVSIDICCIILDCRCLTWSDGFTNNKNQSLFYRLMHIQVLLSLKNLLNWSKNWIRDTLTLSSDRCTKLTNERHSSRNQVSSDAVEEKSTLKAVSAWTRVKWRKARGATEPHDVRADLLLIARERRTPRVPRMSWC